MIKSFPRQYYGMVQFEEKVWNQPAEIFIDLAVKQIESLNIDLIHKIMEDWRLEYDQRNK